MTTETTETTVTSASAPMPAHTTEAIEALEDDQQRRTRVQVCLSELSAEDLTQLLGMTEEFFRTAGPTVHARLREYLDQQWPPADPGWFIDALGFNSMHLNHQLAHARLIAGEDQ